MGGSFLNTDMTRHTTYPRAQTTYESWFRPFACCVGLLAMFYRGSQPNGLMAGSRQASGDCSLSAGRILPLWLGTGCKGRKAKCPFSTAGAGFALGRGAAKRAHHITWAPHAVPYRKVCGDLRRLGQIILAWENLSPVVLPEANDRTATMTEQRQKRQDSTKQATRLQQPSRSRYSFNTTALLNSVLLAA